MAIEFTEDKILRLYEAESIDLGDLHDFSGVLPGQMGAIGNQESKSIVKMTKKEIDNEFENLDLSQFND